MDNPNQAGGPNLQPLFFNLAKVQSQTTQRENSKNLQMRENGIHTCIYAHTAPGFGTHGIKGVSQALKQGAKKHTSKPSLPGPQAGVPPCVNPSGMEYLTLISKRR